MTAATSFAAVSVALPGGEKLQLLRGGSRTPLLYLHGFEGHPGDHAFLQALASSHTVIAPTHPGFDESDEVRSIEDIVDLALAYRHVIAQEPGGPVDLVGHSMGAMIAAEVAALSPHLVRKLVLLNPFGLWLDEAPTPDFFIMTPGELKRAMWATPPAEPATNGNPAAPDKAAMIRRYRNFGAASRYLWPIPDRGFRKRARYVEAPTLGLFGSNDGLIPLTYAAAWEKAIPGLRATVLDGGHQLPFEQPEAVAAAIATFLGE
ncbi:MAG: alpha/beta fold hydrolase [Hyphomicrobiales bacterium]